MEPPEVKEGFGKVITVSNVGEANSVLKKWGARPPELTSEQVVTEAALQYIVPRAYDEAQLGNLLKFISLASESWCAQKDLQQQGNNGTEMDGGGNLSRSLSHYLGPGATARYPEGELELSSVPDWQGRHADDYVKEPGATSDDFDLGIGLEVDASQFCGVLLVCIDNGILASGDVEQAATHMGCDPEALEALYTQHEDKLQETLQLVYYG